MSYTRMVAVSAVLILNERLRACAWAETVVWCDKGPYLIGGDESLLKRTVSRNSYLETCGLGGRVAIAKND